MSVVSVKGLRKTFVRGFFRRKTTAVDGISFDVEAGEVFGFLGPNGAGKTTTMKMLMGLIHPTGGEMSLLGAPPKDVNAKRRIGYLPENPYFYDYLSAREFLQMVGRLYGLDAATRRKRGDELIDRVGLGVAASRAMRSYSKGMMQRVGLAQSLMGDPELLVFDEPMSGLDPIGRREIRHLIKELREKGKTVFFSTHILSDANFLCDRVGIIVKGKMVDVGPLGELLAPEIENVHVVWEGDEALRDKVRAQVDAAHSTQSEGEVADCSAQADVDELVNLVASGGGRVLQLVPQRQTLEDLFARDAGGHGEEVRS